MKPVGSQAPGDFLAAKDSSVTPADPQPPAAASVIVHDASRQFDNGLLAVDGLSISIPAGQFLALLGPSGCGKSTLLRMIAGLDRPTRGRVDVSAGGVGYVFQDAHLLPWRNVIDNVALPLELARLPANQRDDRAAEALNLVGLSEFGAMYPAQLSGGMRMRVSLARALVGRPNLLLLDEPFAALDEITRQQLDDLLRGLWQRTGMTILFVTHSIQEAAYLADRVIVLSRRPARVMLDHVMAMPSSRDAALRTSAAFAAEARLLFQALERGERL